MIYHHHERGILLDATNSRTIRETISDINESRRMLAWITHPDRDPVPRFAREGWTVVTESVPVYDDSPLTGSKHRRYNGDGTWTWYVGDKPWNQAIYTVAQARQQVRDLIDGSVEQFKALTISHVLPTGSTVDGEDASGQTVDIWLIHPELSSYWTEFQAMFAQRGPFANEEFDSVQGRVSIPGADMPAVFAALAVAGSQYRIAWRRLEAAFRQCETAADYDNLKAAISAS